MKIKFITFIISFNLIYITFLSEVNQKNQNQKFITFEKIAKLKEKATFDIIDYENHPFKNLSKEEIINKLGLLKDNENKFLFNENLPYGNANANVETLQELPENFHTKDKWPECIHPIRDQQNCGSCWAFSASEVLSDKFCIASKGKINVILSPQDFVSCDGNDRGCGGGFVNKSWNYLKNNGIVTETCLPYISGNGFPGICPFGDEPTLNFCMTKEEKFRKYKVKAHGRINNISDAKTQLLNEGPLEAAFNVYEDFMSYKGGVYRRTSENFMGGHAVKVVGWGKDNNDGTEYWIVANSWNTTWGEEGFFRIAFGECGFEGSLWTGIPDLDDYKFDFDLE
jgi:cathepsin B